jgi:hypothetical protein
VENTNNTKIILKNGLSINPQTAIFDLKMLRPDNFCNRWTANLKNYLLYTYKYNDHSAKRKEQAEYVSKLLQNVNNLFNTELNLTGHFISHPALRLIPYALAVQGLSIAGLHYYEYSSWPTTLITLSQSIVVCYLYNEYLKTLESRSDLLYFQSKNIADYSSPQTTKTYEITEK